MGRVDSCELQDDPINSGRLKKEVARLDSPSIVDSFLIEVKAGPEIDGRRTRAASASWLAYKAYSKSESPRERLNMVYVNIPYVVENDRLDPAVVEKELEVLSISEAAKHDAFAAIYNKRPRGVKFDNPSEAQQLEKVLYRLGIPYRQTAESDYKYESLP